MKIFLRSNKIILMLILFVMSNCIVALAETVDSGKSVFTHLNGDWLGEKPQWVPEITGSLDFVSKYIWRGSNLVDAPCLQSDLSISRDGFTFDWWTNYSMSNDKGKGSYQEYTEVDYTFDYTFNWGEAAEFFEMDLPDYLGPLTTSFGWIYYTFPHLNWKNLDEYDTHELYIAASYDGFLQPSFTWYWDIDNGHGSYFLFAIGHTFDLGNEISADMGMSVGAVANKMVTMGCSGPGFADMNFSGSVNIPVFNYFTITPSFAYSLILDHSTYDDSASNEFYGGIKIGFEY